MEPELDYLSKLRLLDKTNMKQTVAVVARNDQTRALNFNRYTEPKNVIKIGAGFTKEVQITQDPDTNLTLFNPHLTAKPI